MPFAEDMLPRLKPLAKKLLEYDEYGWLSDVADFIATFRSGKWLRLSIDDQERYLKKMKDTFHVRGMGDSALGSDSDYVFVANRVDLELTTICRAKDENRG